jgi:16S rRNA (guanine1516-N2)-methyltransferase
MSETTISIALAAEAGAAETERLARSLGLPVADPDSRDYDLLLVQGRERLELRQTGKGAPGPVHVDFVSGKSAHRRRFGGGRGQPLARAVGLKQGRTPSVIDATAGLGRDAFVLASLGCEVRMVERSPVIAALLRDGLERGAKDGESAPVVARMSLVNTDGVEFLSSLQEADRPDVVYLDPMYPHREKSSLVKKEMRLFRQLVGDDLDAPALLDAARQVALNRVVVKRPAKAPEVGGQKPSMAIRSPNTRYDVYITQGR